MDYFLDRKRDILRGYLRQFYVGVDSNIVEEYDKLGIDVRKNYTVVGDYKNFKKFCAYYLLKDGRKDWELMNAYTLIEIYLGKYEDIKSIFEINVPYLILTFGIDEMENKRQWDIINQYLSWRYLQGYFTVFFLFSNNSYKEYKSKFSEEMRSVYKVVEL